MKEIRNNVAILSDGTTIPFGAMIWNTGLKANPLISSISTLVAKTKNGRLEIDGGLHVLQSDRKTIAFDGSVFALGDCACNVDKPLPQLAQVAMQQAKFLAKSLNPCDDSSLKNFKIERQAV